MSDNTEDNFISTDEEFYRRLNEFYRKWSRIIFWTILNFPRNCWSSFKSFLGVIRDTFLRQYIAMTVLILSLFMLCVTGAFVYATGIMYCLSFIACCAVSLYFQKGAAVYVEDDLDVTEQKRLLDECNRQKRQKDDQPVVNGAKSKNQASQRNSETVMEPWLGRTLAARNTYQVPCDFHRSDMYTPLNYNGNSAGPSHTPKPFPPLIFGEHSEGPSSLPDPFPPLNYDDDPSARASRTPASFTPNTSASANVTSGGSLEDTTDSFVPIHFSDDSYDSDEPPPTQFEAHLSAAAVKTFGVPAKVFGADSYKILHSSDEHCTSDDSFLASGPSEVHKTASEVKTFEVSVEVHAEPSRSINYSNDGSSSVEISSMASDESARRAGSDLRPYMDDDQSSETTCSTHLDEKSTKTEASY